MRPAEFRLSDFYLACFLKAQGWRLLDVRKEGRRSVFVFQDRPDRKEATLRYYNGEGTVRPLNFVAAVKDLKALIHNV